MTAPLETLAVPSIGGLPLHPLVVHAVVVLLPLAALALVAEVLVPALRRRYAGLTLLVLAGATGAAFLARVSGEALAATEGLPREHAAFGGYLPTAAAALLVAAVAWYLLSRGSAGGRPAADGAAAGGSRAAESRTSPAAVAAGLVTAVLAVGVTVLTVLVGHSGATAVWGDTPGATASVPTASVAPSPTASVPTASAPNVSAPTALAPTAPAPTAPALGGPAATASPPAPRSYTLAEVGRHASAASCWAAVDGAVYDLTSWIGRHPGGEQRILGLCGRDATEQFRAQHGSSETVASVLAGFRIGSLTS